MSRRDDGTLIPAATPSPLLGPALAFCAAIGLADAFPERMRFLVWVGLAVAAVAGGVSLFGRREPNVGRVGLAAAVLSLAFAGGVLRYERAVTLPENHVGKLVTEDGVLTRISGTVVRSPTVQPGEKRNPFLPFDPPPRVRFVLAAEALEISPKTEPVTGLVQVSVQTDKLAVEPGDRIRCTGRLYRPHGAQNPGETDWARIHQLDGIHAGMFVEEPGLVEKLAEAGGGGLRVVAAMRRWAREALIESYAAPDDDEGRGLLEAMILGQRDAVSRALNDAFVRTGTIHVLSVSGFHFALLAGTVYWLARKARRTPQAAALITLPIILLYALVADPNAPLLRSALISVLICVSQLLQRRMALLNWLALAALLLLLWNPLQLFQPGFQLTFVQVAALILAVPATQRLLARPADPLQPREDLHRFWPIVRQRAWTGLKVALLISTVLWLLSLPLVLYHFGRFSPWAIPQTVILTPLVELVTLAGFATEVLGLLVPPLAGALGYLLAGTTQLLVWAVHLLAQLPGSLIVTAHPPIWMVLLTCGVFLLAPIVGRPRESTVGKTLWEPGTRRSVLTASILLALLCLGWPIVPARRPAAQLTVLAVGNGSAAILADARGTAAVLDVGTTRNSDVGRITADALQATGARQLSRLILSHADYDHFSGVMSLLDVKLTDEVISTKSFESKMANAGHMRPLVEFLQRKQQPPRATVLGDILRVGELPVEVLWPPAEQPRGTPDNDTSLVLAAKLGNKRVLIPGDIADGAMLGLMQYAADGVVDLRADVLVAPHHGSTTARHAAEFYRAVGPQVVIVSSGTPRPKLEALVKHAVGENCRVLTTCRSGAVTVRATSEGKFEIQAAADSR